jgi:hypothetical protein
MTNSTKNIFNKNLLSSLKKIFLTPIGGISAISLFLLIYISPIISLLWLCIPTLYFLYVFNYKVIFKIWVFTIGMWYLIFTTSLSEITILIGFGHTKLVIDYLLDNHVLFANLCFQTVYILDALSAKLGFSIYISAVINIFSVFLKLFKNGKSGCSGKEDPGNKEKKDSSWWLSFSKKSQGEDDMSKCEPLARELRKAKSAFDIHSEASTSDGNRTVIYSETWVPFLGTYNNCHARPATDAEKKAYGTKKNNLNRIKFVKI